MPRLTLGKKGLICALAVASLPVLSQQTLPDGPKPKEQQSSQSVPDAPQPKPQQPGQFPENAPPAPINTRPAQPEATPTPTPKAQRSTPGQDGVSGGRDELYKMSVAVNFVQIPVRVKDASGKLVTGLTSNEFKVYEDGVVQQLKFFTADAFPLSAAVIVATDLPSVTMKKVNESLPALIGAFSEVDEVALYRYGHTVQQVSGFSGASSVSTATVNRIKRPGREGGPPMVGGPFGGGPSINGHPVTDPNANGGKAAERANAAARILCAE